MMYKKLSTCLLLLAVLFVFGNSFGQNFQSVVINSHLPTAELSFGILEGPSGNNPLPIRKYDIDFDVDSFQVFSATAGGNLPYSYQWFPGEATSVANPTAPYIRTSQLNAGMTSQITGIVTDSTGCSDTAIVEINRLVSRADIFEPNAQLSIFPNPGDGNLNISIEGLKAGEDLEIVITDLNGRVLKSYSNQLQSPNYFQEIDLENQPAGMYILRFSYRGKNLTKAYNLQ